MKRINRETRRPGIVALQKSIVAAVVLLVAVIVTTIFINPTTTSGAIAAPDYPGKTRFESPRQWEALDSIFLNGLETFAFTSSSLVLSSASREENALFSPLSLYMALALAAETASGETQEEFIRALSMPDLDLISQETGKLFRNIYTHNEFGRLTLANSLWLAHDVEFKQPFLDKAASDYYAHSFRINFSSNDAANQISDWISQHTGGRLTNYPPPAVDQVMTLLNTVYFYDEWIYPFNANNTKEDIFYLSDGDTVTTDFMNKETWNSFVRGDGYTASGLSFKNRSSMVFILPDEGISPYEIINDPDILGDALAALEEQHVLYGEVTFAIPKFRFNTEIELIDTLEAMGIRQAFSMEQADFTNLSDTKPLFLTTARQSAYISIDEQGVEAAAYTDLGFAGSAPPEDKAEMILNRPFIFVITGEGKAPLFIGVINNPTSN